jgi:hypothetical protein
MRVGNQEKTYNHLKSSYLGMLSNSFKGEFILFVKCVV